LFLVLSAAAAADDDDDTSTVEDDIGKSRDASRTDDEVVERYGMCYKLLAYFNQFIADIAYSKCSSYLCHNSVICVSTYVLGKTTVGEVEVGITILSDRQMYMHVQAFIELATLLFHFDSVYQMSVLSCNGTASISMGVFSSVIVVF